MKKTQKLKLSRWHNKNDTPAKLKQKPRQAVLYGSLEQVLPFGRSCVSKKSLKLNLNQETICLTRAVKCNLAPFITDRLSVKKDLVEQSQLMRIQVVRESCSNGTLILR